jgi:hypothetical protein
VVFCIVSTIVCQAALPSIGGTPLLSIRILSESSSSMAGMLPVVSAAAVH